MKSLRLYILITIVITSCILNGCSTSRTVENIPPAVDEASIEEALEHAAAGFDNRQDLSKLREAVDVMARARNPESRNFQVETQFAKYNYFLGIHTDNEKEAEEAFVKGRDAGKIASRVRPTQPDGFFWYGANLGELSRMSPVTVGLRSVDDIKEAMNKVIELQPAFQGASAYDALGRIELATRITGGKAENAVQYLEKGVAIDDDNSNLHLHLALAYIAVNRDKEAKAQLEYVINMRPNQDYLPEHQVAVAAAKKLLRTKF